MLADIAARETAAGFDGILLDLGVSSPQLDDAVRGFSFAHEGPLDMRMDPGHGETAAEWIARAEQGELADVIHFLGEERFARRIARGHRPPHYLILGYSKGGVDATEHESVRREPHRCEVPDDGEHAGGRTDRGVRARQRTVHADYSDDAPTEEGSPGSL
jgi:hypothetical protein